MIRDFKAWSAYIAERQNMPFAWGLLDCVSFAGGAIHALTGQDPLAGIAPWKGKAAALRRLADYGGLVEAVASRLNETPIAMAHRGDICVVDGKDGPFLMVVEGLTLVGPGITGLDRMPRIGVLKAWAAT